MNRQHDWSIAVVITTLALAAHLICGQPHAQTVRFEPMPIQHQVTQFEVTEDGRHLIVVHREAELLTIWNVVTGELVKQIPAVSPVFALSRGERVYIASDTLDAVQIFARDQDWELIDEVSTGVRNTRLLMAPAGEQFDGRLIAVAQGPHPFTRHLIDTANNTHRQLTDPVALADRLPLSGLVLTWPDGQWWHFPLSRLRIQPSSSQFPDRTRHVQYAITRLVSPGERRPPGDQPTEVIEATTATLPPYVIARTNIHLEFGPGQWVAATIGNQVYLFAASSRRGPMLHRAVWDRSGERDPFTVPTTAPRRLHVPAATRFAFDLTRIWPDAAVQLVRGPDGLTIDAGGTLRWSTPARPGEEQDIRLRLTLPDRAGEVHFVNLSLRIEPADQPVRYGLTLPPAGAARAFQGTPSQIVPSPEVTILHEIPSVPDDADISQTPSGLTVLLRDRLLQVFSPDFGTVLIEVQLPRLYEYVRWREGKHFVAVAHDAVDLLDETTFQVKRRIPLPAGDVRGLVMHPVQPFTYFGVEQPVSPQTHESSHFALAALDEVTGEVVIHPDIPATSRLMLLPDGTRLVTHHHGSRSDTLLKECHPVIRDLLERLHAREYGIVMQYELNGTSVELVDATAAPARLDLGRTSAVPGLLPDGSALWWMRWARGIAFSLNDHRLYNPQKDDISRSAGFHPHHRVFLGAARPSRLFNADGEVIGEPVPIGKHDLVMGRYSFSGDGTRLLVHDRNTLYVVPLDTETIQREPKWTDATDWPKMLVPVDPEPGNIVRLSLPSTPMPPDPRATGPAPAGQRRWTANQIQALTPPRIHRRSIEQLHETYQPACVYLRSMDGRTGGTGVFISDSGLVLTAAEAVSANGRMIAQYRGADGENNRKVAQVLRRDVEAGLALLHVPVDAAVSTAGLGIRPPVGGQDILLMGPALVQRNQVIVTPTRGVVAHAQRTLRGRTYFQFTAALPAGAFGSPIFSLDGEVIGIAVARSPADDANFAVPASEVRRWITQWLEGQE